jgi:hypothetical protein
VRNSALTAAALTLLALSLVPAVARAAEGLNLAWNSCYGEGTGVQNRSFACDTNAGEERLVGSFRLDSDMASVNAVVPVPHIISASNLLPEWWQFRNPGSCRGPSISVNETTDPDWQVCEPWAPIGSGLVIAAYCTKDFPCYAFTFSDNDSKVLMVGGLAGGHVADLTAGVEYFVFNLLIQHAKTVGTGACGGCAVPACILFDMLEIGTLDNVDNRTLTLPTSPGSNVVTWQGGAVPITRSTATCPGATPTRNSTWGSVKTLYR